MLPRLPRTLRIHLTAALSLLGVLVANQATAASARYCAVVPPRPAAGGLVPSADAPASVDGLPTRKTGLQNLLFLRVRYLDDQADPISESDAARTLEEAHQLFYHISQGNYGLQSTVTPVLPLAHLRSDYDNPSGFDHLIDDARAAGVAAGFDYRDFDLEVVRHTGVPSFAGGNARLGVRGAQVQADGAVILVHEIGHNLGLSHANFWDTSGPGVSSESPPMPSNFRDFPDPRSIPLHPDSVIGHDTVIGPGRAMEYGDPWDIMGTGEAEFGAGSKTYLGWLAPGAVSDAPPGRSEFRLYEPAGTDRPTNALVMIRIPGERETDAGLRSYVIEIPPTRSLASSNDGVVIRWIDASTPPLGSLLLDASPGSARVNADAQLLPGRTFSDPTAPFHVTVKSGGRDSSGRRFAEVVVIRDHAPNNHAPVVSLESALDRVAPNQPLTLTARVADVDADELSLFWDFGDGTSAASFGAGSHTLQHSWLTDTDVNVRLTASDLRGGTGIAYLTVRVGEPRTRRIHGFVREPSGDPVPGVRVHSGVESHGRPSENLSECLTDSEGRFTLVDLVPGNYTLAAFHPDYRVERQSPRELPADRDLEQVVLTADPLPRVDVSAVPRVAESAGNTNLFTFHRRGSLDAPLTVTYRLDGTASAGRDYIRPLVDRVTIPGGATSASLALNILDDAVGESGETIRLTVVSSSQFAHPDPQGNLVFTYYPGWESLTVAGRLYWTRTRPEYMPGVPSSAEVILEDDDAASPQQVSVASNGLTAFESPRVEAEFHVTRHGDTRAALDVPVEFSGTATPGTDFERVPDVIHFAADETLVSVPIRPFADDEREGIETTELRLLPGAGYGLENDRATVEIADQPEFPQTLALVLRADGLLQVTMKSAPGAELVLESSGDLRRWTPIRTNRLFNSDTATVVLPRLGTATFFRSQRR